MNVFGHDDMSEHHQPITSANALQNLEKEVAVRLVPEKWPALVTTESQKMQVVVSVDSVQALGHTRRVRKLEEAVCDE
jgi:hypothetical protein